ncbi:hypothetical protein COCHEDRAFT_1094540 [Bipolaris maydis C5]|uniref:Rhodanese domain-containing protein n=1 Tax=Cochliobolus heterostrophus (strain C5 / ATCC 48332 / race O) TaxID=701091 RepID=M2TA77_COCH5|nr:hypothetical protein COCHEDRAFT_1094540 [Bipolaris maydis C5]
MAETTQQPSGSWTDAFPAPRITAPSISRDEVLSDLSSPHLLIVDVRRTDYEGGTIRGSINLPAHSFYLNRGVLYDLCRRAGVTRVAFYCDYIAEKGDDQIKSLTLAGGIKGWVKAGEPFTQNMDAFEPEYWKQFA